MAFLIIGLVARLSTIKTRVLWSSIVLMALSVPLGLLTTAYLSQVLTFLTLCEIALALRARVRVLGRLKVTLFHCLVLVAVWVPFFTTLAA